MRKPGAWQQREAALSMPLRSRSIAMALGLKSMSMTSRTAMWRQAPPDRPPLLHCPLNAAPGREIEGGFLSFAPTGARNDKETRYGLDHDI